MRHGAWRYLHFLLALAGGLALAYLPGSLFALVAAMPGCWCPMESAWGAVRGAAVLALFAATGFWLVGRFRPLGASFGRSVLWASLTFGPAAFLVMVTNVGIILDGRVTLTGFILLAATLGYLPFLRPSPSRSGSHGSTGY